MHARIIRWDQSGVVYERTARPSGGISASRGAEGSSRSPRRTRRSSSKAASSSPSASQLLRASSIQAIIWSFAARTADGAVDILHSAPPFGAHHHYTKLSIVTWPSGPASDCRDPWPPGGRRLRLLRRYGQQGRPFTTIQLAIDSLPSTGGEVSILPGRYFEYIQVANRSDIVIKGCGAQTRIASPALQSGGAGSATPAPTASGLQRRRRHTRIDPCRGARSLHRGR